MRCLGCRLHISRVLILSRQGIIATTSGVSYQNQLRTRVLYITDIQHKTTNTPFQHPTNTHNFIKKAVNSRRFLVIVLLTIKELNNGKEERFNGNKSGFNRVK